MSATASLGARSAKVKPMRSLPLRSHLMVWLALMALLALTAGSSFVPLGTFNVVVNFTIAAIKAALVLVFFMHVARGGAAVAWLPVRAFLRRHPRPRPLIGTGGFGTLGARVRPPAPLRDRLPMTAIVCETPRLALRMLCDADAAFILRLVNDPEWLRFIGDRNVHDLRDARRYINDGPVAMRKRHGFALDVVERKEDGAPMGLCGLIKRETLDDVDIGFAFLPEFRRHGFAREACDAVLERAAREFALPRVAAITSPLNLRSMKLLHALGFEFIRLLKMAPDDRGTRFYLLSLRDTPD